MKGEAAAANQPKRGDSSKKVLPSLPSRRNGGAVT